MKYFTDKGELVLGASKQSKIILVEIGVINGMVCPKVCTKEEKYLALILTVIFSTLENFIS